MPLVVALVGCIMGTTVVCLDALALNDIARTTARLASVSSDPVATAVGFVESEHPGVAVSASTDSRTVTVRLRRRISFTLPLLGAGHLPVPLSASSTMAVEPPNVSAPAGTSVTP